MMPCDGMRCESKLAALSPRRISCGGITRARERGKTRQIRASMRARARANDVDGRSAAREPALRYSRTREEARKRAEGSRHLPGRATARIPSFSPWKPERETERISTCGTKIHTIALCALLIHTKLSHPIWILPTSRGRRSVYLLLQRSASDWSNWLTSGASFMRDDVNLVAPSPRPAPIYHPRRMASQAGDDFTDRRCWRRFCARYANVKSTRYSRRVKSILRICLKKRWNC